MSNLLDELKRRKVFRVAAIYGVVAWLLIQVSDTIAPMMNLPESAPRLVLFLLIILFPVSLFLAWAYELTPDGVKPAVANQPATTTSNTDRKLIYATFALVLLVAGFQIADRFLAPVQQTGADQSISEITGDTRDAAALALPETRVDIVTPVSTFLTDLALSPDGRQIVFEATGEEGVSQLWLRSLATTTAQPLAGTEGAQQPFWSPDSRSISFFTGSILKRLTLGSSTPQTLATTIGPRGGAWGADDTLLFASPATSLMRVSSSGGEAIPATTLEPGQTSHRFPHFLPDGRRFLFWAMGAPDTTGIYLGHLDGRAPVRLTADSSRGVFHPGGWLLWVRAGALTAQRLDLAQATLTGEPLILADSVTTDGFGISALSVASTGLIAYRTGGGTQRQLTWFDRTGTILGTLGEPDESIRTPSLSPDGRRVAVSRTVQGNADIWLLDGARRSRFTFDPAQEAVPRWSPDGSRILYRSSRASAGSFYQKPSNGAGEEALVLGSDQQATPNGWSADGRFLLYHSISPQTARDLWAVPMTGDPVPVVVLQTPFEESWGAYSPDGRWLAYQSNESGRYEIYIRAFVSAVETNPDTATARSGVWQVSTAGGIYVAWSPDGRELYYLDPAGNMLAAPFTITGDSVEVGDPVVLFPTRIYGGGTDGGQGKQYDVAADGRFLINALVDEASTTPITLIQNWNPAAVQ